MCSEITDVTVSQWPKVPLNYGCLINNDAIADISWSKRSNFPVLVFSFHNFPKALWYVQAPTAKVEVMIACYIVK